MNNPQYALYILFTTAVHKKCVEEDYSTIFNIGNMQYVMHHYSFQTNTVNIKVKSVFY